VPDSMPRRFRSERRFAVALQTAILLASLMIPFAGVVHAAPPPSLDHYDVTTTTATPTAGTPFSMTVTARDSSNNVFTTFTGTAAFTSSDPAAVLPANYTFTLVDAGVHTFTNAVTLKTAGSRTITATTTTKTGVATVAVSAAAASKLSFGAQPTTSGAGASISPAPTVLIQDAFSNTVTTDGSTSVTLAIGTNPASGTLSGTAVRTAASGVATFSGLSIDKTGTGYTLAATSSPSLTGATSTAFNITAGAIDHFVVSAPSTGTAGVAISVSVTAKDSSGNTITGYTGTAHFTSTDGAAVLPANYGFVGGDSGAHIFSVTLKTVGSRTVSVNDTVSTAATGTSGAIAVSPAAASKLVFGTQPTTTVAGTSISPAVTVVVTDAFGNTITTNNTTVVTLAIGTNPGGGTLSGTASATVSAGIATFAGLSINKAGVGYTLGATSSPVLTAATSSAFTISPAAAAKLAFASQPTTAVAGVALSPAVTVLVQDAFGNTVTTDSSTTITIAIGTNPGGGTLAGTASATAASGIATFSSLSINKVGTGYTLAASSSPVLTGATSTTFNITPAAPAKFAITSVNAGTSPSAGIGFSVVVQSQDAFGNASPISPADTVTLSRLTGTGTLGGTLSGAIGIGQSQVTINGVTYTKAESGVVLRATKTFGAGPNLTAGDSAPFTVIAGPPDHLSFGTQPSTTVAAQTISPAVTVQVEDAFNNLVVWDSVSQVSLAIGTNPGSGTLSGNAATTASGGIATFSALSIDTAGIGYTLNASSPATATGATSSAFTITLRTTSISLSCGTPVAAGAATTCTATVSDTNGAGSSTPAGTVTFTTDGTGSFTSPGACVLVAGSCSVDYTPLASAAAGTDTIGASYGGSGVHAGSIAGAAAVVITTQADLSISLADSPDPVIAGQTLTYTLTIANSGPSDAQAVSVADVLPAGLSGATFAVDGGSSAAWSGSTSLGSLAAGASSVVVISATVAPATPAATVLTDGATVSSTTTDPNAANDIATTDTTVTTQADLSISLAGPANADAGKSFDYTITVHNAGPSIANGFTVADALPSGVTFQAVGSDAACSAVGQAVTCISSSGLAVGADSAFVVNVTLEQTLEAGTIVTNTASISSSDPVDPVASNDVSESVSTTTAEDVALVVTITFADTSVEPGTSGHTFEIDVTNTGSSEADNIVVVDAVPAALIVTGVDDGSAVASAGLLFTVDVLALSGFDCSASVGQTIACHADHLGSGATDSIVVTYRVAASTAPVHGVTNTVFAAADDAGFTVAIGSDHVDIVASAADGELPDTATSQPRDLLLPLGLLTVAVLALLLAALAPRRRRQRRS
jgi:uncharacterized repeat protein (TIGR01451 family)